MSDATATAVGDTPCVLVVGDAQAADDAMEALAGAFEGRSLLRERTLEGALDRLADREIDCLVCPFVGADNRSGTDPSNPAESLLERLADGTDGRPIVAVTTAERAERALETGASDVVATDESAAVLTARVRNAAERERYRRAASETDPRSRAVLESAAAVVWVVDADGSVEYATPAVEPRLGYTPSELERAALTRLIHPEDRETVSDALAAVATEPIGTTDRITVRLGHADGTWQVATLSCTNRLDDPSVEGLVVTWTGTDLAADADEREALREGLDRLEDAVLVLGPRDELRYANAVATRLFGRPDERVPGKRGRARDEDGPTDESGSAGDRPGPGTADAVPTGTVVWGHLPDEIGEPLYGRVREAETTGSAVEFETTHPSTERRLSVAVHPGDDGVTIRFRAETPDDAAAGDRERLALLESVVDAIDDGIAVLEGSTVRLANPALRELADADALAGRDIDVLFDDDLAATVRVRASSPVGRWMDPVSGTLATDPPRPVDVYVAPLPDDGDRTLCVVRDGRGSSAGAVSTIGRIIDELERAETPAAVRESLVDGVREWVDADVAVWYLDAVDGLRPAAVAAAGHTGADGSAIDPPAIDPAGTPLAALLGGAEPTVYERATLEAVLARTGLRAERVLAVPVGGEGVVLATSTEPLAFEGVDIDALEAVSGMAEITFERLECAASLRACRHDRSRLETVAERGEQLRSVERSLLSAETRDEIERRLCEAVVSLPIPGSAGAIELAWVGRADDGRETVVPTAWAGRDGEFLESTTVPASRDAASPTGTAAVTREPAMVADLAAGETDRADDAASWRRNVRERGFRSALSVPLTADEFRFGTLTAYADRPSAFDDRTRRLCEHLATVAGAAMGALETRNALLADRLTELEVVCRDGAEPLSSLADRLERRIDVRAVIPRSSGGSTVFCAVGDGDSAAVRDRIADATAVDSVAVVGGGADETALEIVLTEPTIARTIADHGGVLRSLEPVDDRTRIVIDLGESVDVRSFVRALERRYPGTELVARRQRDRSARIARPFDELADRLSERQRRTLEAAYHGGFFEWPREHTGEEVAESLGVSQPTFSRHLRLAQGKLFALLFDESDGA